MRRLARGATRAARLRGVGRRVLGAGRQGVAVLVCRKQKEMVVKISLMDEAAEQVRREARLQEKYAALHLAPKVIAYHIDHDTAHPLHLIVMEKLDGVVYDLISTTAFTEQQCFEMAEQLIRMIDVACANGLTHGDVHLHNVGYRMRGSKIELQFIDFGLGAQTCRNPRVDLLALIDSTFSEFTSDAARFASECMREVLIATLQDRAPNERFPAFDDDWSWHVRLMTEEQRT